MHKVHVNKPESRGWQGFISEIKNVAVVQHIIFYLLTLKWKGAAYLLGQEESWEWPFNVCETETPNRNILQEMSWFPPGR